MDREANGGYLEIDTVFPEYALSFPSTNNITHLLLIYLDVIGVCNKRHHLYCTHAIKMCSL